MLLSFTPLTHPYIPCNPLLCPVHPLHPSYLPYTPSAIACTPSTPCQVRFDDSMYVSVADDGSLNCWRNETGRSRDASDHFDCANLLPLISPQACDARTGPCAIAPHPEAPCANAPCDAPCANAPCEAPCDAPRNATRHALVCTARRIASSQLLLSSSIHAYHGSSPCCPTPPPTSPPRCSLTGSAWTSSSATRSSSCVSTRSPIPRTSSTRARCSSV